jgi:ATP-dependent Clp protease protease subunit
MLIHQASAGMQGTAADIEVHAREIIRLNARIKELLAADTGQAVDRIEHDINRDYWMSALEARDYGLIDTVVGATDASLAADRAEAALDAASTDHRNGHSRHPNGLSH